MPNPVKTAPPPAEETRALVADASALARRVTAEVATVVVGVERVTEQLLIALLANGHVLLEGVPGVAKTTLSKVFARLLGCHYQRVQFTPDLLPSDVTGSSIYDRNSGEFRLRQGPVFAQILLADEINRAPAKTQSALLEAMQEGQVTIDGTTLALPTPFLVLATQNPIEQEGVYRLPEAQLDRFLLRVEVGYPGPAAELAMLKLHGRAVPEPGSATEPAAILAMQARLGEIYGGDGLLRYIVELVAASRRHPDIALGASPRAALALMRASRARAAIKGRHYFTHEDVQSVAPAVLGHRLILRPEAEIDGRAVAEVVAELVKSVAVAEAR